MREGPGLVGVTSLARAKRGSGIGCCQRFEKGLDLRLVEASLEHRFDHVDVDLAERRWRWRILVRIKERSARRGRDRLRISSQTQCADRTELCAVPPASPSTRRATP